MIRALLLFAFLFFYNSTMAATYYAATDGAWNDANTWSFTKGGSGGDGIPGGQDDAYTNGHVVTVSSTRFVANLFVTDSLSGAITLSNGAVLFIFGTLVSWDDDVDSESSPTTQIIQFGSGSRLQFRGSRVTSPYLPNVIQNWNSNCVMGSLYFDTRALTRNIVGDVDLSNGSTFRVSTGTIVIEDTLDGGGTTTAIDLLSGTSLIVESDIQNASYNFDETSTVTFSGSAQNIPIATYGNLTLSGSGTKIATGTGAFTIANDLSIGNSVTLNSDASTQITLEGSVTNNGTWQPADQVIFSDTATQTIGGSQVIDFTGGGIEINKSGGSVELSNPLFVGTGFDLLNGTLNTNGEDITIQCCDAVNNGTLNVGTGTVFFNGITNWSGTSTTTFNDITVGTSAQLNISVPVNISGDLNNSGSFSATTVNFNGSSSQTISGSGTCSIININIPGSNTVRNNGTIELTGTLDLGASGGFDPDGLSGTGSFILISNALGDARIAELTTPSNLQTGNITYQRFVPGNPAWRYFAIPITNGNLGMLIDDIAITGDYTDATPAGGNVAFQNAPSVYEYNATAQSWDTVKGNNSATSTINLINTTGYSLYVYDADELWAVTGNPAKGPINIPMADNGVDEWNLVPNPYPSPIDWDDVFASNGAVGGTIYMTIPGSGGQFAEYTQGSGTCTNCAFDTNWRGEVAAGRSFWVDSNGESTLSMSESHKTGSATFLRQNAESPALDFIRLTLQKGIEGDPGYQQNETLIRFGAEASDATERAIDGLKLASAGHLGLSTYNSDSDEDYVVNTLGLLDQNSSKIVNLKTINANPCEYTLKFSDFERFTLGYDITLIDNYKGERKRITETDNSYTFSVTSNTLSFSEERFDVHFGRGNTEPEPEQYFAEVYPNPTFNTLNVAIHPDYAEKVEKVMISDFNGNIFTELSGDLITEMITINTSNLNNGIYVLKILTRENEHNYKIYKQ